MIKYCCQNIRKLYCCKNPSAEYLILLVYLDVVHAMKS